MNIKRLPISKHKTKLDERINDIIEIEWNMFQEVNGLNGRASCQDDATTFYIMRYSQHASHSLNTINSYFNDLQLALQNNQNLIQNKYGYMMEYTDYDTYKETIEPNLPTTENEKLELIQKIVDLSKQQNEEMRTQYPMIASRSRPVSSNANCTSSSTYSIGELKTYSIKTLQNVLNDYYNALALGENIVSNIVETTMKFYGYTSLDSVEYNMKMNCCCGNRD